MSRKRQQQSHITLRTAKAPDVPALSELAIETYTTAFGRSMSAKDLAAQISETRSERYFHAALMVDVVILAFVDKRLAGYVQLRGRPQDDDVEINAIYVAPALQGQGIGRALLQTASADPRVAHARQIKLDVWEENPRAIAFYRRHGFEIVGKRDFTVSGRMLGTDLVMQCSKLNFG